MGHSHSQAITQGTDRELKLYCWFTEKDYDTAIKTSQPGVEIKNMYKIPNQQLRGECKKTSWNHCKLIIEEHSEFLKEHSHIFHCRLSEAACWFSRSVEDPVSP